jgi:hypothetical protein
VRPARKADNLTAIYEPIINTIWNPRHFTTLQASTAHYRDSFSPFCVVLIVCNVSFIVSVALCALFCLSVVCYFL